MLVVAPLSVVSVWRNEAQLYPEWCFVDCTEGSVEQRAALYKEVVIDDPAPLIVVGYESYWRKPLRDMILKYPPDIVIYDEAHRLRSRTTKQSRFSHILPNHVRFRLALTGTPIAGGIENLYSIYKAIDDRVFGASWANFQNRYITMGGFGGYEIKGYRNTDEVERKLAETSYRITLEEARGIPQIDDIVIDVDLSPKADVVYNELRKYAIAEIDGKDEHGQPISGIALSRIVLTNLIRLQQVTSGFVKIDDGRIADISSDKLDTALDIVSDVLSQRRKVVIFCRYTRDIDRLEDKLRRVATSVPCYVLDGRDRKGRDETVAAFQKPGPSVLLAEIAVASLGIDLSCADTAIFYSVDWDPIHYTQSRSRMLLSNTPVTYYHLIKNRRGHSIDQKIYNDLADKQALASGTLSRAKARSIFE